MRDLSLFHRAVRAALAIELAVAAAGAWGAVNASNAWVRGTVAPQEVTGAYVTLKSDVAATLVGASSPSARRVELHEMSMQGSVMRMRPVAGVALPAGTSVELKPGGYHLMMMDLTHPLKDGEKVPLVLKIRDSAGKESDVTVDAVVRPLTAAAPAQGAGHSH